MYAFLSNFKVQSHLKLSSKRIQKALTNASIPKFKLIGDSVKIDRQTLCESIKSVFIIDDCYYELYNLDKEPVIVYSPHFSVDYEGERYCKSILLMHLPWSKLGEDGLLIKFNINFIKVHMQQEIHCRDC